MNIYLSAPLFTQMERKWNRMLAAELEKRVEGARIILPQDFTVCNAFNRPKDFPRLFRMCIETLEEADLVVAVLDGADADSGTAFELGYAYALGIPVIGIRTDYRQSQDRGLNLMLSQSCTTLLREMSFSEDLELLARDLCGKILTALKEIDPLREGGET